MLIRWEALILNFGRLKGRLLEGDAHFRGGANSNIYGIIFYLTNDVIKSKLTE